MAIQSTLKNMVLSLGTICLVSSALLAGVYALTKEPIEKAAAAKTTASIKKVLPEFEGEPEAASIESDGKEYKYYVARKGGEPVGYAIMTSSTGFGGPISLMVGVTSDGLIYNTAVLSQSETPGLGAKCTEESFSGQFRNLDPAKTRLAVKKDNGDIDAITASTITSRAYVAAVNNALAIYKAIVWGGTPDVTTGASSSSGTKAAGCAEAPADSLNVQPEANVQEE